MPLEKISVGGPLLREPFYGDHNNFNSSKVLTDYRLDPQKPVFLLGTGANGVNHHIPIIKVISQTGIDCQILHCVVGMNKPFMQLIVVSLQSSKDHTISATRGQCSNG